MNKFKVGDFIKGTKGEYNFTNECMTKGVVVGLVEDDEENDIQIEVLEHTNINQIGNRYVVESKYFELYEEKEKIKMNKTELENKIAAMKVEIEKLEGELNSKSTVFEPEIDDKYYFINELGKINPSSWDCDQIDVDRFDYENVFETEEQAEREAFETKLIRKLKRFALENNEDELDWEYNSMLKWNIYFSFTDNEVKVINCTMCIDFGQVYFTSREIAERAVEEFKEDLMKYFTTK